MQETSIRQQITELFQSRFTETIRSIEELPGAGSSRKYFRIISDLPYSVLACYGSDAIENQTFIYFSSVLGTAGINVPTVFACDKTAHIYLVSDLGETDVLHAKETMNETEIASLYKQILSDLLRIQIEGGKNIDFARCLVRPEFDRTAMRWDLYYFKYYYLKVSGLEFNEQKLEEDFDKLLDFLESADRSYFMYRDFQSRNIMYKNGKLGYIDFQGGMKGPLQYDVVSLLFQAKANLSPKMREELLSFYIEELAKQISVDEQQFRKHYQGFVFIRIIQTLGAYGFRGLIQKKEHFIKSIPQALTNLKNELPIINAIVPMPYLSTLIDQLPELTEF